MNTSNQIIQLAGMLSRSVHEMGILTNQLNQAIKADYIDVELPEDFSLGRKHKRSHSRSRQPNKRKFFPKKAVSCRKRKMNWNKKSHHCNLKK